MLHLEKINSENIWDIVDLNVFRHQKHFVASNLVSIAQAYSVIGSDVSAFPFGIYNGKKPVGFLMIGYNEAAEPAYIRFNVKPPEVYKNNYTIWRLMIDKRYQKRGYGREAINLALDFIRTWPCGKADFCAISWEPENEVASKLYHAMGFENNGETDGDEIVSVLKL